MIKTMLIAALSLMGVASSARAAELDDTQWKLRFRSFPTVLRFWRTDSLEFENGKFMSREGQERGFKNADYEARQEGESVTWSATQTNGQGESAHWEGARSGDIMMGTLTVTRPDGESKQYRWKANMRMSEEPAPTEQPRTEQMPPPTR